MKLWRNLAPFFLLFPAICVVFSTTAQSQTWTQYGPPARFSHTAVFDPTTQGMIVFGGQDSTTDLDLNDTWLIETSSLKYIDATQLFPSGALPTPRYGHVAGYDSVDNIMTIFGGADGTPGACLNDVWILSGANGQDGTPAWNSATVNGSKPPVRFRHTGVYDPNTNSLIVFGGSNCSKGYFSDVWVLSNANGLTGTPTWTELSPTGGPPSARESATAIYDSVNNIMTIYGGDAGGSNFGDVWTLSNANGTGGTPVWTELSPAGGQNLLPRSGQSAVYDSVNNRMTIFGGFHLFHTLEDSWVLTNANGLGGTPTWSEITTSGTAPQVGFQSAVYNSSVNSMYVFAGSSSESKLAGDDHAFTLTNSNGLGTSAWTRGGPPTRYGAISFYDPVTGAFFLQGGQHSDTNTNENDYWQTTGVIGGSNLDWVPLDPTGTAPKARWGHTGVYASTANRLLIFGGSTGFPTPCMNDYHVLTYANYVPKKGAWVAVTPTGTAPPVRMHHDAAFNPTANIMIVFGGWNCQSTYYNDVWILQNATAVTGSPVWTQLSPAGTPPSPRESSTAIYNSSTNTLTVFGGDAGGAPFDDIWVLSNADGSGGTPTWTQLTPTNNGPSARTGHTAVYNQTTDIMTIYGGYNGTALLGDAWTLSSASGQNGPSTWTELSPSGTAPEREFATASYNPASDQMNIFGGIITLPTLPDDHLFSLTDATTGKAVK
jgi:hypothetical protein